jgi:glycosyltransferase involved in cell wall biosynthesis
VAEEGFNNVDRKKMRIVQLGPMPPPNGGVSTHMLAIHETLVKLGHSSTIVDVTNREGDAKSPGVLKPRSAFGLASLLLRLDCDIVHYHIGGDFNLKLALLTLFCGSLPGKRSVVTFHSGGYAQRAVGFATPNSIRGLAFRSIDLLIGVNEQMIRMFKAFGIKEKRTQLILPFELRRPDPAVSIPATLAAFAKQFKPFLLSVGALEPEYMNDFLISAMPRVLEKFPDAGLMIIGAGSQRSELNRQIASLVLEDRIFMTGNLDHAVVLHLIAGADVLLRITKYDGDSIAVREALFLETPVVASDNAFRPEGVFLLSSHLNPANLVQKLIAAKEAQFSGQPESSADAGNAEKIVEAYKEILAA